MPVRQLRLSLFNIWDGWLTGPSRLWPFAGCFVWPNAFGKCRKYHTVSLPADKATYIMLFDRPSVHPIRANGCYRQVRGVCATIATAIVWVCTGRGRSAQASSAQQLAFDCVSASPLKIDVNFMIPLKSEYNSAYVSFSKDLLLCV